MKLWLDDIRPAPDGWIWCKNVPEILDFFALKEKWKKVVEVSLDHDLGENTSTGYDFLCILENEIGSGIENHVPIFHIHSANPVGRKNMQRAIDSINRLVL